MASTVSIRIGKETGRVYVKSPYNKNFVDAAGKLNGKWVSGSGEWAFDGRDEARVRESCIAIYGTDGTTQAALVTLRVTLGGIDGIEITLGGRSLVRRPGRDSRVKLGDGVVVLEGGFPSSGGSVKNPRVAPLPGTVLEVRDFPAALASELGPTGGKTAAGFAVDVVLPPACPGLRAFGEPCAPEAPQADKTTPRPWEAWFNYDADGFISEAGIDNSGRHAGIAEIRILTETVEYDDRKRFNDLVKADTQLIVKAVNCHDDLVAALERLLGDSRALMLDPGYIAEARAALAKAKDGRP